MKVALVQTEIYWEDKLKNFQHFSDIIHSISEADIIVLPEMFTTGFTMNSAAFAEKIGDITTQWMCHLATQKKACLTGSFITTNDHQFFNTLLWVYPNGEYQIYHKRHLFRMAGEHQHYSAGKEKIICTYKGIRFLPLICYDLRFPVFSCNQFASPYEYDVLLYVANWPSIRIDAWKKLLYARAIENLSYVVAVNRIGQDGTFKEYNGQSMAINYKGELITYLEDKNTVQIAEIHKEELMQFREKFPAHLDADHFTLHE